MLKRSNNKGFTLAELVIVVAIIGILGTIAFTFINPNDISYVEYNRSANAIATAAQNNLTEIRNSGDMTKMRKLGSPAIAPQIVSGKEESAEAPAEGTLGGYRYASNFKKSGDTVTRMDIGDLLPFGAIDYELAEKYFVIGFQADTGMVGEVFYSPEPFDNTTAHLKELREDESKRKAENVGYYFGTVDENEIAFANLPTPQLTVTNYEELTLSIYLPTVTQLALYNKELGFVVSLSDEDGVAYGAAGLSIFDTAIYSTFDFDDSGITSKAHEPIIQTQTIESGITYDIILDTVQDCPVDSMKRDLNGSTSGFISMGSGNVPTGKFEDWAKISGAYDDKNGGSRYFLLGDNMILTVTVYCLDSDTKKIDTTFMPRAASVTFNGWFNKYSSSTVEIACGRHLQNLALLTEMREALTHYLPKLTEKTVDGVTSYEYGDFNYGMASTFTEGDSSHADPPVGSSDKEEKYDYRDEKVPEDKKAYVKHIKTAKQVNAIDFDCDEWKITTASGDKIPRPFTPIGLPSGFAYYGNYLTISNLYVNAPFYAGLFGYAYYYKMYDVLLVNPSVTSQMPKHIAEYYEMGVGGLIGTSRDADHINNCQVYMTPDGAKYDSDKYRVTGECYVGGLIGFCEDEHIENCSASVYTGYAKGEETLSKYVGGLVGCITGDSEIDDCYAAGNLSGEYVGGLVGYILEDGHPEDDDYRISTCYSAGHIEYASVRASGIIGDIKELFGNTKAAVSIYGNYSAVIYGEKETSGSAYKWNSDAPIYGTFRGDGSEWIQSDEGHLTGEYSKDTFFAGAVYDIENKNYYIAQKNIPYATSSYYVSMYEQVEKLLQDIESAKGNEETLKKAVEAAKNKIIWLKDLQALEDLDRFMNDVLNELESETGTYIGKDGKEHKYNEGGFYKYTETIYYDKSRAKVEGYKESESHNYELLTTVQAFHVIYDGTYTNSSNNKVDLNGTITYGGSDTNKQIINTYKTYTFRDYYNVLKSAYNTLLNDSATSDEKTKAQKTLADIVGVLEDPTKDTYDTTYKDDKGNDVTSTHRFYENGMLFAHLYTDLFYRLFDKAKDYFQEDLNDKYGELIYRHFRDYADGNFLEYLCDLAMTPEGRDELLLRAKEKTLQRAIDGLDNYLTIIDSWKYGMADKKDDAKALVNAAKTAVSDLKTAIRDGNHKTGTKALTQEIDKTIEELEELYNFFDDYKTPTVKDEDGNDVKDTKYEDYVDTEKTKDDMRELRDPVKWTYEYYVERCRSTVNPGVEGAIDKLLIGLDEGSDITTLVDTFKTEVNTYLGEKWGYSDSGHRLYNAEQLRNAVRGYVYGPSDSEIKSQSLKSEGSLGFMYDYGNSAKGTKYDVVDDTYVDKNTKENGSKTYKIYNNVFPYNESEHTKYYPFPFVFGMELEDSEDDPKTFILFHYGDWLTDDLWAKPVTVTFHTAYPFDAPSFEGESFMTATYGVSDFTAFNETLSHMSVIIKSNDENIDVPYYFDSWYTDAQLTTKYVESTFKTKLESALSSKERTNFNLYAKWILKPSLTFYAADLEGNYNDDTIIVDTSITLEAGSGDQAQTRISKVLDVDAANHEYNTVVAWLKPEQKASLSVSGHYKYTYSSFFGGEQVREETNHMFTNGSNITYMLDSLTVLNPTELTNLWFTLTEEAKKAGKIEFTVPVGTTSAENYVLTLSEGGSSAEGGGGFDFSICLAEGTMIRMADGSVKAIEALEVGDMVLAFDHLTGQYVATAILMTPHTEVESKLYTITTLEFSDGSKLKIVGEHGLFDRTQNEYVFINEMNYRDFIGHEFSAVTFEAGKATDRTVTLTGVSISREYTRIYSPITENQLNIVAEDLLTVTSMMGYGDAVMNIFAYKSDMTYDLAAMNTDIRAYGVYSYDDFADLLPKEIWDKVPLGVMKVAVGKGLISYEEVREIIRFIYENGYLSI